MAANTEASIVISAVDKTAAAFNSISSSMGRLQGLASTLGASLSVGAFVSYTKSIIDAADEMNDLSARVGVGIKQLAGYKLAAEQSGTSIEAVAKGIKGLSTYFAEHADSLKAAGISAKSADDALVQLADLFAAMPDGIEKTALATKLFGKAGMDMIPMLNLGSSGLQEAKDKAAAYGNKLADIAPLADKFNDNLAEVSINLRAVGINTTSYLLPGLVGLSQWMADIIEKGPRQEAALEFLAEKSPLVRGLMKIREITLQIPPLASLLEGDESRRSVSGIIGGKEKQAAQERADADRRAREEAEAVRKAKILLGQKEAASKAAEIYKQLTDSIAAYQAQIDAQGDKQGKLTKAEDLALQVKIKLSVAERARLQPALDKLAADERELALEEALSKRHDEAIAAAEKETESLREQVIAQQQQNETIGLTTEQLAALEAQRLDEQIAAKQSLLAIFSETDGRSAQVEEIRNQIAALQALKSAKQEGAVKQAAAEQAKQAAEEWKRLTDDLERGLTDALMRGFEGGKDAGKNFVDSLKNMLKTAALKIVVQAIVNPVTSSVQGALTSGGQGGTTGGSAGGALSLLSSLSSGNAGYYSAFNSFAGSSIGQSLGLTNTSSFVGPLLPGQSPGLGLTSLGQGLQEALPYLPAVTALLSGNYVQAGLAAAGTFFGGPIGGMIGSAIGGLFGGHGEDPHNNTDSSSVGFKLSKAGVAGFGTGYYADSTTGFNGMTPFSSTYGNTSGGSRWGDNVPLPQATLDAINKAAAQLFTGGAALAKSMGIDPSVVDSAAVASGTFASVEAALSELSDAIVVKVIPNIKDFQQANEKLGDTAQRLVAEFNLTNLVAQMRGKTGAQVFGSGLVGRDQLVQLLGGVSSAQSAIGSYYQNFYSDEERKKNAQGEISATLQALGFGGSITTRDQFRALVDAQDLTTESGRKMYASLVSIADAFAGITEAANTASDALSTDLFKTRADYVFAQKTGIMPHYAAGGLHDGGWAIVGEQGPELANLGPSRVYSHNNSRALLDTTALQNEIAALRSDLRAGQAAMAHSLKVMEKKVKQWDGDGMPAVRA